MSGQPLMKMDIDMVTDAFIELPFPLSRPPSNPLSFKPQALAAEAMPMLLGTPIVCGVMVRRVRNRRGGGGAAHQGLVVCSRSTRA